MAYDFNVKIVYITDTSNIWKTKKNEINKKIKKFYFKNKVKIL